MEIHVKMVAPVLALVLTVSTAGALADTVGFCVKTVKLLFAIPNRVKMGGLVSTNRMDFCASVPSNTQEKDVNILYMIIVHRILATIGGFVHKIHLVLFAVASHHSLELLAP